MKTNILDKWAIAPPLMQSTHQTNNNSKCGEFMKTKWYGIPDYSAINTVETTILNFKCEEGYSNSENNTFGHNVREINNKTTNPDGHLKAQKNC